MADADGTYQLDAIPRLLLPLLTGEADMVLGQRLNDATTATMPWLHRYVGTPAISYSKKSYEERNDDSRQSVGIPCLPARASFKTESFIDRNGVRFGDADS